MSDEPEVFRNKNAFLLVWNAEVKSVDGWQRVAVPEGVRLPMPTEAELGRGPTITARTPADGARVELRFGDERAVEIGRRRLEEFARALLAGLCGDPSELIRFLKTFAAFATHPDLRPVLEKLAEKAPRLRAVLRGERSRGRRVAAGESYARVIEVQRAQPELSFEQAIKVVFRKIVSPRRAQNPNEQEAFRRRVFDEQKRCEPYELPPRIDLEELLHGAAREVEGPRKTRRKPMSKGSGKGSSGSGSSGSKGGGKGTSGGKGPAGGPSTTGKPSGKGRDNAPPSR